MFLERRPAWPSLAPRPPAHKRDEVRDATEEVEDDIVEEEEEPGQEGCEGEEELWRRGEAVSEAIGLARRGRGMRAKGGEGRVDERL